MTPEYIAFQRSLSLLRRLQRGSASRDDLVLWVHVDYDMDAYTDAADRAGRKRLENDLARLKNWGVEIDYHSGLYHLKSYGDFNPVYLSEEELNTLAFLSETFAAGAPDSEAVQQLLRHVADWLPQRQRDSIPTRRQRLRVDLRRRDEDVIDPLVQAEVDRAVAQHRRLRFGYRAPGQADGVLRVHTVEPWGVYFDTVRRHLYLDAYRLRVEGPLGDWREGQWQSYRLGRIQREGIEVLADKLPPTPPRRPRHALEYWLAPEIARLGEITRHFDDMQVHGANDVGWVRVTATTSDLFRALRLLLGYGANCRLVGGAEARREMEALVGALSDLYGAAGKLGSEK